MHTAGCARVAFQCKQFALVSLDEIEGDLSCKITFPDKCFHPIKNGGMFHVPKDDRRALPRCEYGWISGVRVDNSIVANRISAIRVPLYKFLRDPGRLKI